MKKIHVVFAGLALALATSCSAPKPNLKIFDDLSTKSEGTIPLQQYKITIQPQDELLISVTSTDPTATAQYNLPLSNPATLSSINVQSSPQQQTYIVNEAGDIIFPALGKIHVEGMTTTQLAEYLTTRISADVTDPLVRVELVNFMVNVIGEVKMPGRVRGSQQRFSIIDALSSAGYMTEYGDRSNVMIIREKDDGQAEYHYVDLTKSDVVSSPYYYLRQNDVVVVSPTEVRESNARYDTNASYRMQVVSTIVSGASVIASLVIALTVK